MQADYQTQIPDARGEPHAYNTVAIPGSEGTDLLLEIAELMGGPIGHFIQALFSMKEQNNPGSLGVLDADLSSLPQVLERLPQLLLKKGGHAFIQKILRQTSRCEISGPGENKRFRNVGEKLHYDSAYASNYAELFRAVKWVLECNYAPFGDDGTPSWKGLWLQLSQFLPIVPASEPTTS